MAATSIFSPCPGSVVAVKLPDCGSGAGAGPGTFNVTIDGDQIAFPVTGVVMEMQGSYQFLHALDNFIYHYSFGDRIGEMTVSGIGFVGDPEITNASCAGDNVVDTKNICGLHELYMRRKQSTILDNTLLKIGHDACLGGAYWAFLTGMRLEVSAGVNGGAPLGQWSLRLHVIPPRPPLVG